MNIAIYFVYFTFFAGRRSHHKVNTLNASLFKLLHNYSVQKIRLHAAHDVNADDNIQQ